MAKRVTPRNEFLSTTKQLEDHRFGKSLALLCLQLIPIAAFLVIGVATLLQEHINLVQVAGAAVTVGLALALCALAIYLRCDMRIDDLVDQLKVFSLECPSCGRVVVSKEAWRCKKCLSCNNSGIEDGDLVHLEESFLNRCSRCGQSSAALMCPDCSEPIVLNGDDPQAEKGRWAELVGYEKKKPKQNPPKPKQPTQKDKLRKKVLARVGPKMELRQIRQEELKEAEKIEDPQEREVYIENINMVIDDLLDEEGI